MTFREAHYRKATNNKKCFLCGSRTSRLFRCGTELPAQVQTCLLIGGNIEDDHTCDYWENHLTSGE